MEPVKSENPSGEHRFSTCGSQTSSTGIPSALLVRNANSQVPTPDLLSRKLMWDPAIWVWTSPSGDSDACSSLGTSCNRAILRQWFSTCLHMGIICESSHPKARAIRQTSEIRICIGGTHQVISRYNQDQDLLWQVGELISESLGLSHNKYILPAGISRHYPQPESLGLQASLLRGQGHLPPVCLHGLKAQM